MIDWITLGIFLLWWGSDVLVQRQVLKNKSLKTINKMAKKTSKGLFEEWRGKKVTYDYHPAIVVGYDVTAGPPMLIISTDINTAWGSEALTAGEDILDITIETPYKKFITCVENQIKLAE